MVKKKQDLKDLISKIWSRTKRDLENALDETAKLIKKGEKHLREMSERSKEKLELMSLKIRREDLYYKLGKAIVNTPRSRWRGNKKIEKLLLEIRKINREIKRK